METTRSKDGTVTAFERSGSGPALVVVGGALSDRRSAAPLRPLLDPHFTLCAYDRRGRGDSGDAPTYAPERELEDLAAVTKAVGPTPFLYAHSSGAILALRAVIGGLALRALAVNEPPYIPPGGREVLGPTVRTRLLEELRVGEREAAVTTFLCEAIGLPRRAVDFVRSTERWPDMVALAHTTAYDAAVVENAALPEDDLRRFAIPTLVIHGGASLPWIGQTAMRIAELVPGAESAVLANQPHAPAPGVLAPELIRFFGACARASEGRPTN